MFLNLQNEFHDNQTWFEGFMEKRVWVFFWLFLGSSPFRPQNIRQEASVKAEKLAPTLFLQGESEKNGLGAICWPPRFQLRVNQQYI